MRELETIQTQEKLNSVYAMDERGSGGANHRYYIQHNKNGIKSETVIQFQQGARMLDDSISGVLDCDLLEITRDRLKSFQQGEFASEYNEQALFHVEKALHWMNKRIEDRITRNVLGKEEK